MAGGTAVQQKGAVDAGTFRRAVPQPPDALMPPKLRLHPRAFTPVGRYDQIADIASTDRQSQSGSNLLTDNNSVALQLCLWHASPITGTHFIVKSVSGMPNQPHRHRRSAISPWWKAAKGIAPARHQLSNVTAIRALRGGGNRHQTSACDSLKGQHRRSQGAPSACRVGWEEHQLVDDMTTYVPLSLDDGSHSSRCRLKGR